MRKQLVKSALTAVLLLTLHIAAFIGIAMLIAFGAVVIFTITIFGATVTRKWTDLKLASAKLAIYFVLLVSGVAVLALYENIAKQRRAELVTALTVYEQMEGAYPQNLVQLVPKFMPRVKTALPTLLQRTYKYTPHEDTFVIAYASLGGASYFYDSRNPGWTIRD